MVLRRYCLLAARRLGVGEAEAEDLTQEALVRLLEARSAVNRPRAWLRRVLSNLHARQMRRAVQAERRMERGLPARQELLHAEGWQARIDVHRLLDRTSPRSREVLELLLLGHTHREIATELRCEVHQVGPRIARALGTARRRLTPEQ